MLIDSSVQAQTQSLFVYCFFPGPDVGNIVEVKPGGIQGNFSSGLGRNSYGLAVNSAGDIFEADVSFGDGGNINKLSPDGVPSIFASGVTGSLAIDSTGNLFVGDIGSGNIYKYTPGGVQSTFASGVGWGGLTFDSAGNLWATDGSSIYKYTPGGVQSTFLSGLGYSISGMAVNSAGDLFVAQSAFGGSIYEYTPGGVQSTFVPEVGYPTGLAIDSTGNLWVSDAINYCVDEFTPDGVEIFTLPLSSVMGSSPEYLAFQPVPEPSVLGLLAIGATARLVFRRRCASVEPHCGSQI
jgi:streptogramin lyase